MTDLTKPQRDQIPAIKQRIANLRGGGVSDRELQPALFLEGWEPETVRAILERKEP